jgi:hypothetical protein
VSLPVFTTSNFGENTMPIVKLTPAILTQGLNCPPGKTRLELCDADLPGLYIEVRATAPGQGTFYYRYKDTIGKTCHKRIGSTTDITLADARKQAKVIKGDIAKGIDPKGEPKKVMLTYDAFFQDEYLPYVTPRKRSWKRDEELYRLRIKKVFGHLRSMPSPASRFSHSTRRFWMKDCRQPARITMSSSCAKVSIWP